MWLRRHKCLHTCKNIKHTFAPTHTRSQTPSDSSICSPYPLESAPKTKRRPDGLRMLFQPLSFLDNLITSGHGDAARSAPVQGHSLLGPRLRTCAQRRGAERRAHGQLGEARSQNQEPLWLQYNTFIIESDKVCAITNGACVLLIISDPGEQAVCSEKRLLVTRSLLMPAK